MALLHGPAEGVVGARGVVRCEAVRPGEGVGGDELRYKPVRVSFLDAHRVAGQDRVDREEEPGAPAQPGFLGQQPDQALGAAEPGDQVDVRLGWPR